MDTLEKWFNMAFLFIAMSIIGVYNSVEFNKSYHNTLKQLEYVAEDLFETHKETNQLFTTVAGVRIDHYGRYNPANPKKDVLINDDSLTYYVNDHDSVYTVTFYDMKLIDYGKPALIIYTSFFIVSVVSFLALILVSLVLMLVHLVSVIRVKIKNILNRKKEV